MRFIGTIPARLDAKGRVFFPSTFRKLLPGEGMQFVLKRDVFQPCLVVYPYNVWLEEVDALHLRLNRWNKEEANILRQFLSDVEVFSLDSNGRFLIPKRYLESAEMTDAVTFIGLDDRIELWSKQHTEVPFVDAGKFADTLENIMSRPL